MIKYLLILYALMLTCCGRTEHQQTDKHTTAAPDPVTVVYSFANENALADVLKKCKEQSKTPVLYFYADWCSPCIAFRQSLADEAMKSVFKQAMLIGINIDNDTQRLTGRYAVTAVPTFIKIDTGATAIAQITSAAWGDDTAPNIAPVMDKFLNQTVYDKK